MGMPTYQQLADLVCALAEENIANIDEPPCPRFVSTFTYPGGTGSRSWQRAIKARESLIASKFATRRARRFTACVDIRRITR